MRNSYKQMKSDTIESEDINNTKIDKGNLENTIAKINLENNPDTQKHKEIYKNKIISKISKYNNQYLTRPSSFSGFENKENNNINKLSRNNEEIAKDIKMMSIDYIKRKKEKSIEKRNNSATNIKEFYSPNRNIIPNKDKSSYTLNSESTSVTKKKKFEKKLYKSNKSFTETDKEATEENKENISNNIKSNGIPFSPEGNNCNKGKVRTSFKYLIHQAYKNKGLSKSFCRFYKSSRSKEKNNESNEKQYTRNRILKMNCIGKTNNIFLDISKISRNSITSKYFTSSENNTSFSGTSYNKIERDNIVKDFEIMFSLLKKIKVIINKLDKYELIQEELHQYIQYYFNNLIYNKLTYFFSDIRICYYLKKEIICFLLCYDISFSSTAYNQTGILLKTILTIIYSNYVLILYTISLKNDSSELDKYLKILEKEISDNKIKYEGSIIKTLEMNIKYISNYYKMIVDNIYKNYNINLVDKNLKFPNCINKTEIYKNNNILKINLISSFFNETFKLSNGNIYSFTDLKKFFYLFLYRINYNHNNNNNYNNISHNNNYEQKKDKINNSIKSVNISSFNLKLNNQRIKYLLPKIKKGYEYSLVLDLDETLVSYQKNSSKVLLRPGLKSFLHNMKKIYELILFTSATHEYVDPIVNYIEKDEKYFDYILYRKHLSFDEKGEYFKNLNLLNRNYKNIIIVDDTEKNFKLHKSNGICLKPFYGENDNILNILMQILVQIKLDAEKVGDIRICLKQIKKSLIYKIIENKCK